MTHTGTIRIAAVEVSHWHALYDSAYLRHAVELPDVALVAVADPSEAVAAERAAALGNPAVFTDYKRMLEKTRPDFVIALGRHRAMPEIAHHLLDARLPFLMEKPLGISAADARGIAERAAAEGGFVAVPLGQRYHPFALRARQLVQEGRLGPLSHFYFRLHRPGYARYPRWGSPWMLDPEIAGGGCLRNLGPHALDLFLHLTGEDARVTAAQLSRVALGLRVEDSATALLRTPSGVVGTVEVGNTMPLDGTDADWKLAWRDGYLRFDGRALTLTTASGEERMPSEPAEPIARLAVKDALDHWRRGEPPPISAADCARAATLIDQAYTLATDP